MSAYLNLVDYSRGYKRGVLRPGVKILHKVQGTRECWCRENLGESITVVSPADFTHTKPSAAAVAEGVTQLIEVIMIKTLSAG